MKHLSLLVLAIALHAGAAKAEVAVVVSVDWEGQDIRPENLARMDQFRRRFPDVPLMHYLNAAYFTKPGARLESIRRDMRAAVLPIDSTGVHLHGWVSLFQAAGVRPRYSPLWSGSAFSSEQCRIDCGHEVPVSAYTRAELEQVLRFSKQTLAANGFDSLQDFRTGGWMGASNVQEALCATGFRSDSSAVPVSLLSQELYRYPLLNSLTNLWGNLPVTAQPIATACQPAPLWQVPNNGALADYVEGYEMMSVVQQNHNESQRLGTRQVVMLGFHQESAMHYLDRLESFLDQLKAAQAWGQLKDVRIVSLNEALERR